MTANIVLYTKGYCPYCTRAKALLTHKGITSWTEFDLEKVPEKFTEMVGKSNGGRTVPQIFIDGTHVGGASELFKLDKDGKLDALLNRSASA